MESNIAVILFDEAGKAELAYEGFSKLEAEGKIKIDDAIIAYRDPRDEATLLPSEQTATNIFLLYTRPLFLTLYNERRLERINNQ